MNPGWSPSPEAKLEYDPPTHSLPPTMSQEQAEQDEAALRKRVRELIDEERELYDALA